MGPAVRIVVAAIMIALVALVVVAVWTAVPEDGRGLLVLAAAAIGLALYGGLYFLQRRLHW
jgi:hypothetical protein